MKNYTSIVKGTPYSLYFHDTYFTPGQGMEECRYVFIEGNNIISRASSAKNGFTIVECGFGTGLNFFTTAFDLKDRLKSPLTFISFEKYPIGESILKEIYLDFPDEIKRMALDFLKYYSVKGGIYTIPGTQIALDLRIGDALELTNNMTEQADALYLDGFAPDKNPGMWGEDLMSALRRKAKPGCTLSTFTAAGKVKKALRDAGFFITRKDGFGTKRHMITGYC